MSWEQFIFLYLTVITASFLGSLIATRLIIKDIVKDMGTDFAKSVDTYYEEKEKDIKRDMF